MRVCLVCAFAPALVACSGPAMAQNPSPPAPKDDVAAIVRRLSERVEVMEQRHEADQQRIRELEDRLGRLEAGSAQQPGTTAATDGAGGGTAAPAAPDRGAFDFSASGFGATNQLNPAITVFADLGGSVSSRGKNNAVNRFNLREFELDLRAAISPTADGVLILSIPEDIQSDRSGDITVGRDVEIEEAYINFPTLPHDLALKIGKFRNVFGRNNPLHTHDLPQITRPLAVTSFFGPEGLGTTGASLSWLVPNPWDKYIEATVEAVNADGGMDSPILGGPNADNPAVVAHMRYFDDLTETSSLELGGSYLFTKSDEASDFDANVLGMDITYLWTDPNPALFRGLMLQGEAFWARNDVNRGRFRSGRNDSIGGYAFAQYQFDRDWYAGLRGDYSEFPNSESRGTSDYDVAIVPYVTWYQNEFLRLRLQFEHRVAHVYGDSRSEEVVSLQLTGVIGAHPPHPYWVHR